MYHIFVLIFLAGHPSDVMRSHEGFDTKEICEKASPALLFKLAQDLQDSGLTTATVGASKCATDAEMEAAPKEPA